MLLRPMRTAILFVLTVLLLSCAGAKRVEHPVQTATPNLTPAVTPTVTSTATPVLPPTPTPNPTPFPALEAWFYRQADQIKYFDYSVCGIRLGDPKGARRQLGNYKKMEWFDGQGAQFFNEDDSQLLCLFRDPWDAPGAFRQYRVTWRFREEDQHIPVWKGKREFVSGLGIKVRMTKVEVVKILGPPHSVEKIRARPDPQCEIHYYHYQLRDMEKDLDYFYCAQYYYSKGVLAEFSAYIIPQKAQPGPG